MKIGSAIEGGLAGAATLNLLREALKKADKKGKLDIVQHPLFKKMAPPDFKKQSKQKKFYIDLASELLGTTALFGMSGFGDSKHTVGRGALLGAAAGIISILLAENSALAPNEQPKLNDKLITMALYTLGGMLAAKTIKTLKKQKRKRKK